MRSIVSSAIGALVWSLALSAYPSRAALLDDGFDLRQLTEDNFKSSTNRGLWLVEHMSPKCSHCRAFAPTWEKLARHSQHLERLAGFHMAQVNCLAQMDLCNTNGIKYYPQLMLYADGVLIGPYTDDRSFPELSGYIEEVAIPYARTGAVPGHAAPAGVPSEEVLSSVSGRPNPEGKILELDEVGLATVEESGPVLIEYYAPWCGHCKKLRPTYEQLASAMRNKLNIVAIDCQAHGLFCKKQGVMGYPTIRLSRKGKYEDYTGSRSLSSLKSYALRAVEHPNLQPIKLEDFEDIVASEEAFFLYLQTFDTSVNDLNAVKSALDRVDDLLPTYTSADPLLYRNLSIANPPPTSVLLAFSAPGTKPIASLTIPASSDDLRKFVDLHRYPTLIQLSASNYAEIMQSDTRAVVVLGVLHSGQEGNMEREKLEKIARAWKKGGRRFEQPVWFAWIDGERWASWMKQAYGIKKKNLPAAVVIDPPLSEYYDRTIEGAQISFGGASIFSVLEGFHQHFLRPKKSELALEWGSRSATMTLISLSELSFDHPLLAMATVISAVAVFVFYLAKCLAGKDPRDHGYPGEKHAGYALSGGGRLD